MQIYYSLPFLQTRNPGHISRNTEKNVNTAHDVTVDVIKPKDARNFTSILNVVQAIFIESMKYISMCIVLTDAIARFTVQMHCYLSLRPITCNLRGHITTHLNSNHALLCYKALK